ncbi:AzlC family ABC transporter permease [Kineosporia sp. R_H_3]|uniref:AzlC family ABC transporter permease n=1 Tax=Kineosporia sp. R_H_3 TaxID=1961848 RepID=UPI0018E90D76|nr:AzlC family ABC transporter permease [Kineosporia sp. R_H_3]
MSDAARTTVLRQALSVGVASGSYAVSFGALSVAAGLSVAQTVVLSTLMFTGGSQFALVGVLGAGGGGAAAVATAGFLGVRNGFYGLTMSPLLGPQGRGWRRPFAAHMTLDESTAVGTAQLALHPGRRDLVRLGFWATGLSVFVFWNAATLLGAYLGDALGDPRRYGLDAAAAAAFLALLWPRLVAALSRGVAAVAVGVALVLVPVTPAGVPVLAAAVVGAVAGLLPARAGARAGAEGGAP